VTSCKRSRLRASRSINSPRRTRAGSARRCAIWTSYWRSPTAATRSRSEVSLRTARARNSAICWCSHPSKSSADVL